VDVLLRKLIRTASHRGFGGQRGWLLIAGAAFILRRARRADDPVALSVPLNVGDRLLVTLSDPGSDRPGD
jgi:hypothetical protein